MQFHLRLFPVEGYSKGWEACPDGDQEKCLDWESNCNLRSESYSGQRNCVGRRQKTSAEPPWQAQDSHCCDGVKIQMEEKTRSGAGGMDMTFSEVAWW